jgi:hypothetical protein
MSKHPIADIDPPDYRPARSNDPSTSQDGADHALSIAATQKDHLEEILKTDYERRGPVGLTAWDIKEIGGYTQTTDFTSRLGPNGDLRKSGVVEVNGRRRPDCASDRMPQQTYVWIPVHLRRPAAMPDLEEGQAA